MTRISTTLLALISVLATQQLLAVHTHAGRGLWSSFSSGDSCSSTSTCDAGGCDEIGCDGCGYGATAPCSGPFGWISDSRKSRGREHRFMWYLKWQDHKKLLHEACPPIYDCHYGYYPTCWRLHPECLRCPQTGGCQAEPHGAPPDFYGAPPEPHGAPSEPYLAPPESHDAPPEPHETPPEPHGTSHDVWTVPERSTPQASGGFMAPTFEHPEGLQKVPSAAVSFLTLPADSQHVPADQPLNKVGLTGAPRSGSIQQISAEDIVVTADDIVVTLKTSQFSSWPRSPSERESKSE